MTVPALFDLSGKVSLVTGGNRGIGFGMAQALAAAGSRVVIWGSQAERNAQAVHQLRAIGAQISARAVDVSDEGEVIAGMDALIAEFGRIDTVIANAGVSGKSTIFIDSTAENLDVVLSVNLRGAYFTLREGCRHMVARAKAGEPGGSLIGVSSLGAFFGMAGHEAYSASKGAMVALMQSLAVAHGRFGIRANTVAPGFISTELNPGLHQPGPTNQILPRIPLGTWGEGADFGGIAVYLASDASRYHTGDTMLIDGGFAVQ